MELLYFHSVQWVELCGHWHGPLPPLRSQQAFCTKRTSCCLLSLNPPLSIFVASRIANCKWLTRRCILLAVCIRSSIPPCTQRFSFFFIFRSMPGRRSPRSALAIIVPPFTPPGRPEGACNMGYVKASCVDLVFHSRRSPRNSLAAVIVAFL